MSAQSQIIVQKVERLFAANYLFDPMRDHWRRVVCPPEEETAPFFPLAMLLGFVEVSAACNSSEDVLAAAIQEVNSKVVEVRKEGDSNPWEIRRKEMIAVADDPEKRTVFVKPVHYNATEEDIRDFFQHYGAIEKVERRTFIEGAVVKPRPSVFIVFESQDAAAALVAARPSFGSCGSGLGDLWLPRLTCMLKAEQDALAADDAEREYERQQKETIVRAAAGSAGAGRGPQETTRFLKQGCTCKITNVAPTTQWSDIKVKLSNLIDHQPSLKGQFDMVRVVANGVGYVTMKSPKGATDLIVAYRDPAHKEAFVASLKTIVPNLALLEGAEEERVMEQYPTWTTNKVAKKQKANEKYQNSKRGREE